MRDNLDKDSDFPDCDDGYYDDEGTKINPELIVKPALCLSCEHENDASQEMLCTLNRMSQLGEPDFKWESYEAKSF